MSTLILHPGSPKTATSTLQHVLRQQRKRLARSGIGLILPEDLRGKGYLGKYLGAYRGGVVSDLREASIEFFAPYRDQYAKVICSEETFCHDFMPSKKFGQGGIDRAEVTAELLSMTGFENMEIVLTLRPQADLLTSTYTHFVHRHRETRLFGEWLKAEVDLDRMLWQPAVAAFRQKFGVEAVKTLSLDMARSVGMDAFLQAVLTAMIGTPTKLSELGDTVHNPSPSQRAVELCRVMNAEIRSPLKSEKVNSFIVDQFPVAEFGKFKPSWKPSESVVAQFSADYAAALAYP